MELISNKIYESYGRMEDSGRQFDIRFWQSQGNETIFEAAHQLILDAILLKQGYADEPRLQKSIESFQKI